MWSWLGGYLSGQDALAAVACESFWSKDVRRGMCDKVTLASICGSRVISGLIVGVLCCAVLYCAVSVLLKADADGMYSTDCSEERGLGGIERRADRAWERLALFLIKWRSQSR